MAAKKLGLNPADCLVVEDAAAGIEAAKIGGMKSLGVGPFHEELGADFLRNTCNSRKLEGNFMLKGKKQKTGENNNSKPMGKGFL